MESPLHAIADLPASVRNALAEATGLTLDNEQQFCVVIVNPRDVGKRQAALADIHRIAEQAEKNIAASGMSADEFDALADEVCDDVRHGRQS